MIYVRETCECTSPIFSKGKLWQTITTKQLQACGIIGQVLAYMLKVIRLSPSANEHRYSIAGQEYV